MKVRRWSWVVVLISALLCPLATIARTTTGLNCQDWADEDALWVATAGGEPEISCHADQMLIPASSLKIATALIALKSLGETYRFPTEVYRTPENDLVIKGYGDPLLISESVAALAQAVAQRIAPNRRTYRHLLVDVSYFASEPALPGVRFSRQPYDSPTGALCVNFNTVHFIRRNGMILSAEAETPMVAFARERIRKLKLPSGRLLLTQTTGDASTYAGHLIAHFLRDAGITLSGTVRIGRVSANRDRLVVRYVAPYTLTQIIQRMMRYSNNFIANQLYLASGAARKGAPATLIKAQRNGREWLSEFFGSSEAVMIEGAGLARDNRISARQLGALVEAFSPWHDLLRIDSDDARHGYKTGTLTGIRTRAGFMVDGAGHRHHYAVLLNSGTRSMNAVLRQLRWRLNKWAVGSGSSSRADTTSR